MERLELTSELSHLKAIRAWLTRIGAEAGLEPSQIFDLKLAVGEAFTNCVEHAYDYQTHGTIHLTSAIEDGHLVIRIRDRGTTAHLGDPKDPDLTKAHEGGYGLYLMRRLTDRFLISDFPPPGTTVILMKRIPGIPSQPAPRQAARGGDAKEPERDPADHLAKESG